MVFFIPETKMTCWICRGEQTSQVGDYLQCSNCGHMILSNPGQTHIVNAPLDKSEFSRPDAKDQFQINVAEKCIQAKPPAQVLDVGSGPGRFLFFMSQRGHKAHGIEVTDSCVQFSQNELGLHIENRLDQLVAPAPFFDLVTAWHSVEHIPVIELKKIFKELPHYIKEDSTRLIVCVPNTDSMQWKLFGKKWLYYDYPNHIHQFSDSSLKRFLKDNGWEVVSIPFSWNYAFWGNLLSIGNFAASKHNFLYYLLKRKQATSGSKIKTVTTLAATLLFILIGLIPSLILTIIEAIFPSKSGVITLCCHRPKQSNS
jgi:2-polyprenyl-3-methyl-5-hydroxy-6-metoxy-1,4-benzoquinol methylase